MRCDHVHVHRDGLRYEQCTREATHQVTYRTPAETNVIQVCRYHAPWKLASKRTTYCQIETIEVPQTQE